MPLTNLAAEYFALEHRTELDLDPIHKGASGRHIVRITAPDGRSVVGIHNGIERPENRDFTTIARWLHSNGVPAPDILAEHELDCLTEDLGSIDLLDYKFSHLWPAASKAYRSALDGLRQLHTLPTTPPFELSRRFDLETYLWEQDYFFEHLVGTHLKIPADKIPDRAPLTAIAEQLAAEAPVMVHRDFQSQNLMVTPEGTKFIDFQGMRPGHAEYDLASLLLDPYTQLTEDQQNELLDYWKKSGGRFDEERYLHCALQRLMQALGAFANIAHNLGNPWYLQHIPTATASLRTITTRLGLEKTFTFLSNNEA